MTAPTGAPYPASFTLDPPERIANWRPLVHWLLAIPHMVILYVISFVAQVVGFISWLAILFTGKLPEGMAGVQMLYLRYTARVYAYAGFLVEEYPPFTFATTAEDPGDAGPLRVEFQPALEGRNRLTTFFRLLLAIPHLVVLAIVFLGVAICWVIAFFAVLFTGRWPAGLRDFVVGALRWNLRANAYVFLLTDEYPPFSLE
jgi:hypothetical protein